MQKYSIVGLRAEKGVSQDYMAKLLGLKSRQAYANRESGASEFLFDELITMRDFFGVPIDQFKHPKKG